MDDITGVDVRSPARAVLTAADLMSRPIASIDHTAPLRRAVEELVAGDIGALVVLHGTALAGIVSERDVVAHLAAGADIDHLTVGDVMQPEVVTTTWDAPAREVARVLAEADVRHLPVLSGDEVVGVVSARDVVATIGV